MGAAARDDEIDDLLRSRPPIDVIAEKDLKRPRPRIVGKVGVDRGEQFRQQIRNPSGNRRTGRRARDFRNFHTRGRSGLAPRSKLSHGSPGQS
jgi:hypothetical protein